MKTLARSVSVILFFGVLITGAFMPSAQAVNVADDSCQKVCLDKDLKCWSYDRKCSYGGDDDMRCNDRDGKEGFCTIIAEMLKIPDIGGPFGGLPKK